MAMAQTPTFDQNFNKNRQVLPPIHETLLPMRHNYFSSPIRDTTHSPTVCQPTLTDSKSHDTSHSLYYPITSFKASSSSETRQILTSQASSGLDTAHTSYTTLGSSSSSSSSSTRHSIIESGPIPYPSSTTTQVTASHYSFSPAVSSVPSAELQQTTSTKYYESNCAINAVKCDVEQASQSRDDTVPTTSFTQPLCTSSEANAKNGCSVPRQRVYVAPINANNPSGSTVTVEPLPVSAAQENLSAPSSGQIYSSGSLPRSLQQNPPSKPLSKTLDSCEKRNNRTKKAAESSANVDEEVARNVTKILCASLKQKGLHSYSNGISSINSSGTLVVNPCTSGNFSDCGATESTPIGVLLGRKYLCNACNKAFTSLRNLQRHRSSCKSLYTPVGTSHLRRNSIPGSVVAQHPPKSVTASSESLSSPPAFSSTNQPLRPVDTFSPERIVPDVIKKEPEKILKTNDGMGPQCEDSFLDNAVAEMTRNEDFDLITPKSITPNLLDANENSTSPAPPREDVDNVQRVQSAECPSFSPGDSLSTTPSENAKSVSTPVDSTRVFTCEYCNKSVSSNRSLKRHHSTCKLYQNRFKVAKANESVQLDPEKPSPSESPTTQLPSYVGDSCTTSQVSMNSDEDSSSNQYSSSSSPGASKGTTQPRRSPTSGSNICENCNKMLCSASNLKRHRATCKVANTANTRSDNAAFTVNEAHAHSVPSTPTVQTYERYEDPEMSVRNHLNATLAASSNLSQSSSSKNRRRFSSGGNVSYAICSNNTVTTMAPQHNIATVAVPTTTALTSLNNSGLNLEVVATKPWITVGEHLKAQHTQRINQQRQIAEQKRAELQAASTTDCSNMSSCSVMKCVPLNQTYIYSIQPANIKQPNVILWSQGNVVTQSPVITVMTTATDSNVITIPSVVTTKPLEQVNTSRPCVAETKQEKDAMPEVNYGSGGPIAVATELGIAADSCATVGEVINKKLALRGSILSPTGQLSQLPSNASNKPPEAPKVKKKESRSLNSTITTIPIPSNRFPSSTNAANGNSGQISNLATYSPKTSAKSSLEFPADPTDFRFECPECFKTYSCRKNVKRHRMAVHKLSADEVSKTEPVKVLVASDDDQKRQRQITVVKLDERTIENYVTEAVPKRAENEDSTTTTVAIAPAVAGAATPAAAPTVAAAAIAVTQSSNVNVDMSLVYSQPTAEVSNASLSSSSAPISNLSPGTTIVGQCWQQQQPVSAVAIQPLQTAAAPTSYQFTVDENAQLAKIEEDLRRSAEFKLANINEADSESEVKKSVAELAEADTTTLSEDCEDLNNRLPSHPGSVSVPCNATVLSSPSPCSVNCAGYPMPDMNTVPCVNPPPPVGLASQLPPIWGPLPPVQQVIYQQEPAPPEPKPRACPPSSSSASQHRSQPRPRNHSSVPKAKQPHICADCNRTLSSDYSLKRHRSTCVEVKANAAAKAAAERSKEACQLRHDVNGSQVVYGVPPNPATAHGVVSELNGVGHGLRMSQHLSPLIEKDVRTAEVPIVQQSYNNFEDDVDSGVMCQICDCWLSGRREFDRHCEQRHPIVVDADSTTVVHSYDQSMTPPSAFLMHSPNSDMGSNSSASCSPAVSRKRNRYGSPGESSSNGSKTSKHLCLACGKYYSSEWNLERHRRESCPLKAKRCKVTDEKVPRLSKLETLELPPLRINDAKWIADCFLILGDARVAVSKAVLSMSSTYFASLFQYYEGESEIPLAEPVDPSAFSLAMEVFNGHQALDERSIDCVMYVADKFGIKALYEKCETFVAEKLPSSSVMHAIRLADEYNMLDLKSALFSSISIDVFRGLSADKDYCLMEPELKAELLEKWGTFL